jgi:hypothetical protein
MKYENTAAIVARVILNLLRATRLAGNTGRIRVYVCREATVMQSKRDTKVTMYVSNIHLKSISAGTNICQ